MPFRLFYSTNGIERISSFLSGDNADSLACCWRGGAAIAHGKHDIA